MPDNEKVQHWVWVVTETIDGSQQLLALEMEEKGIKFIPAFQSQEDGTVGIRQFEKKPGATYELEAMNIKLLAENAKKNGLDIMILDASGKIIEHLSPDNKR